MVGFQPLNYHKLKCRMSIPTSTPTSGGPRFSWGYFLPFTCKPTPKPPVERPSERRLVRRSSWLGPGGCGRCLWDGGSSCGCRRGRPGSRTPSFLRPGNASAFCFQRQPRSGLGKKKRSNCLFTNTENSNSLGANFPVAEKPSGKTEQICPVVKSIPFKTEKGTITNILLSKWKKPNTPTHCGGTPWNPSGFCCPLLFFLGQPHPT